MDALEELMLAETPVADLGSRWPGSTGLLELQLQGTHVVDLAPLAGLTQLQGLNLARTPVHDVTPLAALSAASSGCGLSGAAVVPDTVTGAAPWR